MENVLLSKEAATVPCPPQVVLPDSTMDLQLA
jgi:hypothetical protein